MFRPKPDKNLPGFDLFFARLAVVFNPTILERVQFAYIASKSGHSDQVRDDGTRYFDHPKGVAWIYINEFKGIPEAHGLCFSVQDGIPVPPSLRNIFLEIQNSIYGGQPHSFPSDLSRWARQGVLLLNASLSVVAGHSNSHADLGWHRLTDDVIKAISEGRQQVVFMLWGAFAQKKGALMDRRRHLSLKTSDPSPL